jgi:exosortase
MSDLVETPDSTTPGETPPSPVALLRPAVWLEWLGRWRDQVTIAGALLAGLVLFAYRGLISYDPDAELLIAGGAEGFTFEPAGGSPALIFAVSAWMLWRRRDGLRASFGSTPWGPSGLLLPIGSMLALWAQYVEAIDLLIPSLSLVLIGLAGLLGGLGGARTILLPALFLLFALPIPAVLVNQIIFPLQLATAEITGEVLHWIGMTALVEGDLIFTKEQIFQVIETCSGLRLMTTLAFSAVIYSDLLYRTRLHMLLLVLLSIGIGALVNVGRVLSIVLNPYSEFAAVHSAQGVVMLVLGVLLMAGVDLVLHRFLPFRTGTPPRVSGGVAPRARLAVAGALLLGLGLAPTILPTWVAPGSDWLSIYYFPKDLGGWQSKSLRIDEAFLGSVGFSERIFRSYQNGEDSLAVFVGADTRLGRQRSLRSVKTSFPGTGWVVEERGVLDSPFDDLAIESFVMRSGKKRRIVLHWRQGIDSLRTETLRSVLALDRGPFRRPGRALAVRLEAELRPGLRSRAAAESQLLGFAPLVREALDWLEQPDADQSST